MQLTISNKFALRYKYLLEAMDVQPPIHFKVPPAHVRSVNTYAGHYRSDEMRKLEAVVACLVLEAGGEGTIGMEAVNEVIHNRAKKQNKSLYQIVTAPKQFSCFNAGIDKAIQRAKNHPKWTEATRILKDQLTDHTNGADHYHTLAVRPSWGKTLLARGANTVTIGHHKFYYL